MCVIVAHACICVYMRARMCMYSQIKARAHRQATACKVKTKDIHTYIHTHTHTHTHMHTRAQGHGVEKKTDCTDPPWGEGNRVRALECGYTHARNTNKTYMPTPNKQTLKNIKECSFFALIADLSRALQGLKEV